MRTAGRLGLRDLFSECPIQVYIVFQRESVLGLALPRWIFNHTVSDAAATWRHIPCRVLAPVEVPVRMQDYCSVLKQTAPVENIVKAGLRNGLFMTKPQMMSLWQVERFAKPLHGQGSGTNGGVVKADLARAVLQHYFPDIPQESDDFQKMFKGIMGSYRGPVCPDEVLAAVEALDPISAEDFRDLKNCARNQKHSQQDVKDKDPRLRPPQPAKRKKGQGAADASHDEQACQPSPAKRTRDGSGLPQERIRFTPGELHGLIPGRGCLAGVYLKRVPGGTNGKLYQAFYPATDEGYTAV